MRAAHDDGSDCFPGSTQVTAAALDRRRRGRKTLTVGVQDACQGCHPGNELDEPSPNSLALFACRRAPTVIHPEPMHGTPSVAAPVTERNTLCIIHLPYPGHEKYVQGEDHIILSHSVCPLSLSLALASSLYLLYLTLSLSLYLSLHLSTAKNIYTYLPRACLGFHIQHIPVYAHTYMQESACAYSLIYVCVLDVTYYCQSVRVQYIYVYKCIFTGKTKCTAVF